MFDIFLVSKFKDCIVAQSESSDGATLRFAIIQLLKAVIVILLCAPSRLRVQAVQLRPMAHPSGVACLEFIKTSG